MIVVTLNFSSISNFTVLSRKAKFFILWIDAFFQAYG
jgi:hypothetical protein